MLLITLCPGATTTLDRSSRLSDRTVSWFLHYCGLCRSQVLSDEVILSVMSKELERAMNGCSIVSPHCSSLLNTTVFDSVRFVMFTVMRKSVRVLRFTQMVLCVMVRWVGERVQRTRQHNKKYRRSFALSASAQGLNFAKGGWRGPTRGVIEDWAASSLPTY